MKVEMFTIPGKDDWVEYFTAQCDALGIKDATAIAEEAARVYSYYATERKWRDNDGGKIKFWPRIAEISANSFKKRQQPGYVTKKLELSVPDCCFRPVRECDCATLIMPPPPIQEGAPGGGMAGLMMQAMEDVPDHISAAYARFMRQRRMRVIAMATHAEDTFARSAATDLGRGIIELFDGTFTDHASEYFDRMGYWIEFAHAVKPDWCHLGREIWQAYVQWVADANGSFLYDGSGDPFITFKMS